MRVWQTLWSGLVGLLGVVAVLALLQYGAMWYQRWRAQQMLAAVRTLRPGVTTKDEYLRAIRPVRSYFGAVEVGDDGLDHEGALAVAAVPNWEAWALTYDSQAGGFASARPDPVWFAVIPAFQGNSLLSVAIEEGRGSGHPISAAVTIVGGILSPDRREWTPQFKGYQDDGQMKFSDGTQWERRVLLDDRATEEQRQRALDFRFDCFTDFRLCKTSDRFLKP